jgi:hydroxyacyl-ACP dehydratase HTD2-like protein with hotdog domain
MSETTPERHQAYIGKIQSSTDTVSPQLIQRLAATLDAPVPMDGTLPPLGHWLMFQDWVPARELGDDGHPLRGGFLPPEHDLQRRMWGAGRIQFQRPLRTGETVTRTSTILTIKEKHGSAGRMLIVTVGHEISGAAGPAISEQQDIIYRGIEGAAVKSLAAGAPAPADAFSRQVLPDPVSLFRYSALTGNGHRIHYDATYATQVEGYPGLVVHGPLQATWLADLLARQTGGATLAQFNFRGQRAAIAGKPLLLEGWREQNGFKLQTRDADGVICMSATATIAN